MKKITLPGSVRHASWLVALGLCIGTGCQSEHSQENDTQNTETVRLKPDPDNGSIELPDGFEALVVADTLGSARHMVVRDNGDIYVALRKSADGKGIVALRDTTQDGRADIIQKFGDYTGTGIDIHKGYLYFAPDTLVVRYKMNEGDLLPQPSAEIIAQGFDNQHQHEAKPFTFDEAGNLYVTVGAPSNACQDPDRTPGTPGQDPCPILEKHGGIWQFKDDQPHQDQMADGHRYATGIRNAVALDWNKDANSLYALQHGRDQLNSFWPKLYTDAQNAELPAEEFFKIEDGSNFGWPYCYYDWQQDQKLLNPEYGGDGKAIGRCDTMDQPIMAFPGHWAPNDLLFYTGDMFPERYKKGAFIAFHGSWNRAPKPQAGFFVAFVPFEGDKPSGDWERFADGFPGADSLASPGDAEYRPMGLAQGPDGSLYIADSQKGRIWRVVYQPQTAATPSESTPSLATVNP